MPRVGRRPGERLGASVRPGVSAEEVQGVGLGWACRAVDTHTAYCGCLKSLGAGGTRRGVGGKVLLQAGCESQPPDEGGRQGLQRSC